MTSKVMGQQKWSGTAAMTGILQKLSSALTKETPANPIQAQNPIGQTERSAVADEVRRADLSPEFGHSFLSKLQNTNC